MGIITVVLLMLLIATATYAEMIKKRKVNRVLEFCLYPVICIGAISSAIWWIIETFLFDMTHVTILNKEQRELVAIKPSILGDWHWADEQETIKESGHARYEIYGDETIYGQAISKKEASKIAARKASKEEVEEIKGYIAKLNDALW